MKEFCKFAYELSAKTYQQRLLDAGMPQDPGFPLELERLAARGAVRGYLLFHTGVPTSYSLCYTYRDTLTLDKTGFDPEFAHLHPGTVLTYLMLHRLFEQKQFAIFDFGSGHFDYKEFFSTGSVRCADIMFLRRTPRNFALVYAHCGLNLLSERLKRLLDILGVKARLKKLIHRRL